MLAPGTWRVGHETRLARRERLAQHLAAEVIVTGAEVAKCGLDAGTGQWG